MGVLLVLYSLVALSLNWVATLTVGSRGVAYLGVHAILTGIFFLSLRKEELSWKTLLFWGVMLRAVLCIVPAFTSHDLDRYFWDGNLVWKGMDPYRTTPASLGGALLPDNPNLPTLYPPLALALFAIFAKLGVVAWKLFLAVAWCGIAWFDTKKEKSSIKLFWWLFFPLSLLEGSVGGHVDILVGVGLFFAQRLRSGFALGLSILLKIYPVVLLPTISRKEVLVCVGTVVLGYFAAWAMGWSAVGSFVTFLREWSFGSPFGLLLPRGFLLLLLGAVFTLFWQRKMAAQKWCLALFALSPVVFPWYLVGPLAIKPFPPTSLLWIWASLLPLTYEVIDRFDSGGGWEPKRWPLYFITMGWAVAFLIRARLRARHNGHGAIALSTEAGI